MGYINSFLFVFFVIALSTLLEKKKLLTNEGSRKLIHIGVGNCWFIAMYYFTSPIAAIVPFCFVILNYISYKKDVFSAMERDGNASDLGTVYYSISLCVLALWTFGIGKPEIGLLGIMIMAYGDGFAAIVGKKWGKTPLFINKKKSLEGSLVVLVLSFIISVIIFKVYFDISLTYLIIFSLCISFVSTLVEAIRAIQRLVWVNK